jgi:imidazolonepropionase-like amidohydrolase
MKRVLAIALITILHTAGSLPLAAQSTGAIRLVKVIKAGRLIDTVTGRVLQNQIIVIEGDKIRAVGPRVEIPDGAEIIDLSNKTVLPGLMDAHVHLIGDPTLGGVGSRIQRTGVEQAITAHLFAERTLMAGFTTVRDLGSVEFVSLALKRAIEGNNVKGPRMLIANYYIGATGSPADIGGGSPMTGSRLPPEMTGVADGPDAIRQKVRWNIRLGADVIKFGASSGVLSDEKVVGVAKYTQEEMNALVDEAHRLGVKVAAHAHGTEAIKMAIRAGVDSIEHGSLIDDEGIRMMKEKGTYLTGDIYVTDYILSEYAKLGAPELTLEKERVVGKAQRENFRKAVKAGVKIAFGTDAGVYPHGTNARQFAKMVEWGMTPMAAIQAATINNADLFGMQDLVGSITAGKFADVIAVSGDPLSDISTLEKVEFVMKGGTVWKAESVGQR